MSPRCEALPGGLRVVLVPCEAESVAVGLFVASGSRHETAKTAGISHFIEHMLFKGTPTRKPIDITREIEGRGGNFNACTGEETTSYYVHLPSEYLAEALDILSDMYLRATIPDEEFVREREVVIEEIRMYEDEPDSVAMENLQRALFPASTLGAPVAGSPQSLKAMKPADLRRYIRSHYLLSRTVLAIAGDFDDETALRLAGRAFCRGMSSRRRPVRTVAMPSPLAGRPVPRVTAERDIHEAQLALGYRTFGIGDSRKYAASVMDAVLGRGMSSRLFQEVREKRGLSYDIGSRMQFFQDAGMFVVTAGLDPAKREKALAVIDSVLRKLVEKRVSAAELTHIKEFMIGNFRLSHERVTAKMFYYAQMLMTFGRLVEPAEQIEGIRAVTAAELQAVAAAILQPSARCVSWVLPRAAK